ncbi:MAG TPA: hypothetical protein VN642_17250 [Dongiaceae bacterium]|nr:hypothetical protein [Dongiaceae bacterium]
MSDYVFIYLIVALNTLCQIMLIWRQKLDSRWKFCSFAIAIPVVLMVSMRLLIASGVIHGHVAEQSLVEQYFTKGTSILLIAGPWLVTLAALQAKMKNRVLLKKHAVN